MQNWILMIRSNIHFLSAYFQNFLVILLIIYILMSWQWTPRFNNISFKLYLFIELKQSALDLLLLSNIPQFPFELKS